MKFFLLLLLSALLAATGLVATERIPPAPDRYFNDYAGVVTGSTAGQLDRQLEQFERDSSNQLVVAIYPKMESDSSVEDYTVRVAQSWRAGQAGRKNGAVLFAFMQEHQLYLQVGYGLEGAIPDATAKRIIEQEIVPRFRAGDVDGGMMAAVNAMIAAAKGEYHGTGRTVAEGNGSSQIRGALIFFAIILVVIVGIIGNVVNRNNGRSLVIRSGRTVFFGNNNWWNGGGSGGSSWGGGGGGGFSGGGGSFGGGGAGGKW